MIKIPKNCLNFYLFFLSNKLDRFTTVPSSVKYPWIRLCPSRSISDRCVRKSKSEKNKTHIPDDASAL